MPEAAESKPAKLRLAPERLHPGGVVDGVGGGVGAGVGAGVGCPSSGFGALVERGA